MNNKLNQTGAMDNILYELDCAIDTDSTKKMLAFQYFNNDLNALAEYLKQSNYCESKIFISIEPKAQLELSF